MVHRFEMPTLCYIACLCYLYCCSSSLSSAFAPTISTTTTTRPMHPINSLTTTRKTRPASSRLSAAAHGADINLEDIPDVEMTAEELSFLSRTKTICEERNIPFDEIKNARDVASVAHSPAKPGRVLRMGRPSDASTSDIEVLLQKLEIKTLVDLRSPTELKDDPTLERKELFNDFVSLVWIEKSSKTEGKIIEMKKGQPRIAPKKRKRDHVKHVVDGISSAFVKTFMHLATPDEERDSFVDQSDDELNMNGTQAELTPKEILSAPCGEYGRCERKERHFVSLMNEFKYVKGTLSKLRKRDIARVLLRSPGAIVSRRVRTRVKDVFLDEINDGGLPMLNELLLRFGAPGIKYVLDLCADKSRHPVAFYCTAGKDRTGMITALILSVLGVPDEDIVEDYSLSANVYAEMNDHKAMVGALSQRNLDPKTFLGAPPSVMRDTLEGIRESYGSVEGYLDFIGFGEESREKLKDALLSD